MTKRELIDFLEPFDDDIQIFTEGDMGLIFEAIGPRYAIGQGENRVLTVEKQPVWYELTGDQKPISAGGDGWIKKGEGLVIV